MLTALAFLAAVNVDASAKEPSMKEALAAPAGDLAQAYLSTNFMLENVLPYAESGVIGNIHVGGETITPRNAAKYTKTYRKRQDVYVDAIRRRGHASLAGSYEATASESCARVQSFWIGLIQSGNASTVEIEQDGADATLILSMTYEGETRSIRSKAAVVEASIVIADEMNSDYYALGEASDFKITIRPDVRVLSAWPGWASPPKREDILKCAVELVPVQPAEAPGEGGEQRSSVSGAADLATFCDRLPRAAYARFEKHESSDGWFEVYQVSPGVWAIYEPFQWQEVISYLIIGTESSVLFDTGNGIGKIKPIVDQLTDKPVRVLNSHSHFDHIGGNFEFDEILSVSTEFSLSKTGGIRSEQVALEVSPEALCKELPKGVTRQNHRIRPFPITGAIGDGDVLDIGGRELEVLRVPGHTDDAIALLDRQGGLLWSGDSFYEGPIWLFAPETDLSAYRRSMRRLASLAPDLRAVFPAHNTPKADPALLIGLRDSLELVLAGEVEPVPVGDGNVEFGFNGFSFLMREDYYRIDDD